MHIQFYQRYAGLLLLQAGAPQSVTADMVETGQARPTLNLPEVGPLTLQPPRPLKMNLTKSCQPALEEPQDEDMVGQRDGVVAELEGVGVGKGDGEYREKCSAL